MIFKSSFLEVYMKVVSWNVAGFRACLKKGFEEFFNKEKPDVICIQEAKLLEKELEFKPEGYYYYLYSADKKGYSGTLVYTRVKPLSVKLGINVEEYDLEGRIITLEFEDFYIINAYVPNVKRDLSRMESRMNFEDIFRKYLNNLSKSKNVIVCGDFNDIPLSYTHQKFNDELKDAFTEAGNGIGITYNQHRLYFRIDHILVSQDIKVYECEVDDTFNASDHYPIWCSISWE